jgi:hypothetical protein
VCYVSFLPPSPASSIGFEVVFHLAYCVSLCYHVVFLEVLSDAESHDGSVGIALGYGLDSRGSRVRFPAGAGNFSLQHRVQKDSGAQSASYPMGTGGSFPGGEAAGA